MANKEKGYTQEAVIKAIKGSQGLYSRIAQKLGGCHHSTAKKYVQRWTETQEAYSDEVNNVLDLGEDRLYNAIELGEPWAVKFYLSMKGQERGYISQPIIKVENEEPLKIDFSGVSKADMDTSSIVEVNNGEDLGS